MADVKSRAALVIFWVMIVAAPVCFGAVDRWVQVALVALLAAGLWLQPVRLPQARPWMVRALGLLALLLVAKEFLPASLFGSLPWRESAWTSYAVKLPWTHHPEPGRAVDALLTAVLAVLWLQWVRSLAADHELRGRMAWGLAAAGAILALVCFFMPGTPETGIYGVRPTPGWAGFGPFPNRNHTACFLAMSAVLACGLVVRAARGSRFGQMSLALGVVCVCLAALLASESRGGLLVFGFGACVYALLVVLHEREHRMLAVMLAVGFVVLSLFLAFGAPVLARFASEEKGQVSNQTRKAIWEDTFAMWRDAPLWGHGAGSFARVYPFYQEVQLEGQVVLHPESSWWQWLAELGAVPFALGTLVLVGVLFGTVRRLLRRQHGFHVRAAAFAGVLVLLLHALWDVPAHRWATAGCGLALLGLASASSGRTARCPVQTRRLAPLAAAIVLYWGLPFVCGWPVWSPTRLERELGRNATAPAAVSPAVLQKLVQWFPLTAPLHHALGLRLLPYPGQTSVAIQHLRFADRLQPASWYHPVLHARVVERYSQPVAMYFWMVAIERAGHRAEDVLLAALEATGNSAGARAVWTGYAEANPRLLLTLALHASDEAEARRLFSVWWEKRRAVRSLDAFEIRNFYTCLGRWGSPERLMEWMEARPWQAAADFRQWAALLMQWELPAEAWKILSRNVREPAYPTMGTSTKLELLEARWMRDRTEPLTAQAYAAALARAGMAARADQIVLEIAAQKDAPEWFRQKAAYLHARAGDFTGAVNLLLREDK